MAELTCIHCGEEYGPDTAVPASSLPGVCDSCAQELPRQYVVICGNADTLVSGTPDEAEAAAIAFGIAQDIPNVSVELDAATSTFTVVDHG